MLALVGAGVLEAAARQLTEAGMDLDVLHGFWHVVLQHCRSASGMFTILLRRAHARSQPAAAPSCTTLAVHHSHTSRESAH